MTHLGVIVALDGASGIVQGSQQVALDVTHMT